MKFIEVNSEKGKEYLNVSHVISIQESNVLAGGSYLILADREMHVSESPKSLYQAITGLYDSTMSI